MALSRRSSHRFFLSVFAAANLSAFTEKLESEIWNKRNPNLKENLWLCMEICYNSASSVGGVRSSGICLIRLGLFGKQTGGLTCLKCGVRLISVRLSRSSTHCVLCEVECCAPVFPPRHARLPRELGILPALCAGVESLERQRIPRNQLHHTVHGGSLRPTLSGR